MNHLCKTVGLIAFVALLTAGPAFTETPNLNEASTPAASSAPVAYVYVQTTKGINVYDATAAGKLTLVKGSPFATVGQMEGINGKYLISVGTNYVRTYAIESNGGVGKQVSETNTQGYSGAECGTTFGAVLDHTGKYFYVQLFGAQYQEGNTTCTAWQSYEILPDGKFAFLSSVDVTSYEGDVDGSAYPTTIPTISSSDKFGYSSIGEDGNYTNFVPFTLAGGQLEQNITFTEAGPEGEPNSNYGYSPFIARTDPNGHLAVLLMVAQQYGWGNIVGWQLASYTINSSTGAISSTNTWENMPETAVYGNAMDMSPSGNLIALAGAGFGNPGLQIFHFNGADPVTAFSSLLLPTVVIDQLAWDKTNHLYALSYETGQLYVYTVTPTSISQNAGSPYTVKSAYGIHGLIVVPKP